MLKRRSPQLMAPTSGLPPLARLSTYSTERISRALANLRAVYISCPLPALPTPASSLPKHAIHDTSVPDSGYASAEEDEDEGVRSAFEDLEGADDEDALDVDVLRSDAFEREFAIRWLAAFAARSDAWVYGDTDDEVEQDARAALVDEAASLLASFAGEDEDEEALTRTFSFSIYADEGEEGKGASDTVEVELNDAPLLSEDHTSVGLQSWGSSIMFAERMCAEPETYFGSGFDEKSLRILELGAGTGMLSIAAAKLLSRSSFLYPEVEIVATDYHAEVLSNLHTNVRTNFPPSSPSSSTVPVLVTKLDWQAPEYILAPLDKPFDIVLAADVVYQPEHAQWIKACVERVLRRPPSGSASPSYSDETDEGGAFWLIIPVRSTGRHEGMVDTVEAVFPSASTIKAGACGGAVRENQWELAVVRQVEIGKLGGVGRVDESCYRLFKIGWVAARA